MPFVKSLNVTSSTPYLCESIIYSGMSSLKNLIKLELPLLFSYNRCIILLNSRIVGGTVLSS
jgi:hypothetical protein